MAGHGGGEIRMTEKCSGCGTVGDAMIHYRCTWPDGKVTTERFCPSCESVWRRQLTTLGASFERMTPDPDRPRLGLVH
jgi:hypothetical protein